MLDSEKWAELMARSDLEHRDEYDKKVVKQLNEINITDTGIEDMSPKFRRTLLHYLEIHPEFGKMNPDEDIEANLLGNFTVGFLLGVAFGRKSHVKVMRDGSV